MVLFTCAVVNSLRKDYLNYYFDKVVFAENSYHACNGLQLNKLMVVCLYYFAYEIDKVLLANFVS